ncbi:hypothetical protein P0309_003913 [Citrobacter freundii]|nr:hypothetical protein [Citrobacter freundii]
MAKFTKELAKLFRKITNSEIDAEGNAHVVLSPADSLLINNARIALASLEADDSSEPVAFINGAWELVYYRPPKELGLKIGDKLYTAPPAPVALPSGYSDFEEIWSSSTHPLTQDDEMKDFAWDIWNACRAAMLQSFGNSEQLDEVGSWNNHMNTPTAQAGNSPLTPDGWQLVPKEPTAAMNKAGWDAINEHDAINPTYRAMLAAAPQQEVKSSLEHGMQRYAGAMQKLSEGDK